MRVTDSMSQNGDPNYRPLVDGLMILACLLAIISAFFVLGERGSKTADAPTLTPKPCDCRISVPHLPTGELSE
jgi:hypothetical protein